DGWQLPSFSERVRTRAASFALIAAQEAWLSAGLSGTGSDADVLKIHASVGWGAYDLPEWEGILMLGKKPEDFLWERTQCGYAETLLDSHFRPGLGVSSHLAACAASTQAIGRAYFDLKKGHSSYCLAGGADSRLNEPGI